MVCIPYKKAVAKHQDLENYPGPCQVQPSFSPLCFPKAHNILWHDSWYRNARQNQQLPASAFEISYRDFVIGKVENPTMQLSLSWRETGISVLGNKPGTQLPEFIRADLTYFHSLVPWDRGFLHMDTESPHTWHSKKTRFFKKTGLF